MADLVFNIAKGRIVEFYNRVKSNDPSNAAFIVVLVQEAAAVTDDNYRDADTLAAVLALTDVSECDFTNYARKTITDADLAALPAPDDGNDRYDVDLPDQTYTAAGGTTDNTITRAIVCYDSDTTGGADSNIIPCVAFDFSLTTNGGNFALQFNSSGFFRAA